MCFKWLNIKIIFISIILLTLPKPNFAGKPDFKLYKPGAKFPINYTKYGTFEGIGTKNYKYVLTDGKGLRKTVGEGIYPNSIDILKDPAYKKFKKQGKLKGNHWEFLSNPNKQLAFFKWAKAADGPGIKMFHLGTILEKAGLLNHALKAYHSCVIHFPDSACWNAEATFVWYVAPAALDTIKYILKTHPELELKLIDANIKIDSKGDTDTSNDTVIVNPGKFIKYTAKDRAKDTVKLSKLKIIKKRGEGKVNLVKYENNHWQLRVNNKPYFIKGMCYGTETVGKSPVDGTQVDWFIEDNNDDDIIDGPYESWVDKNENNERDKNEKVVGDFKLLKDMNCNTIRIYHHCKNKKILRDLYKKYGIMSAIGDFIGMYGIGSGVESGGTTDYEFFTHRKNMLKSVKEMVLNHKDEDYLLLWILGNENNYGCNCNANRKPKAYYKFVNEVAKMIKKLDPDHPVALCNGDLGNLNFFAEHCPDVDILACNAYRGERGFSSLWEEVSIQADRAVFISEYGAPAYLSDKPLKDGEEAQERYHKGCWIDIDENKAGKGAGNSLGGFVFEWLDGWWKCGDDVKTGKHFSKDEHDTEKLGSGPFADGWGYSEWFGIIGHGDGKNSPFLRQLRKSYFLYKKLWK